MFLIALMVSRRQLGSKSYSYVLGTTTCIMKEITKTNKHALYNKRVKISCQIEEKGEILDSTKE